MVGAQRDGHEYHTAWVARKSLQLLWPDEPLHAIAVEGLSEEDEEVVESGTVEIADVTLYFGRAATIEYASKIRVCQLKYSVARENTAFTASDAAKTLKKFASSYVEIRNKFGVATAREKFSFELITNRPIHPDFSKSINSIVSGSPASGTVAKQSDQVAISTGLKGNLLQEFARLISLVGKTGDLQNIQSNLLGRIIDWSPSLSPYANARFGDLTALIRKKAGAQPGPSGKLIFQTDVLGALGVSEIRDLLPCPEALPPVKQILNRVQLPDALEQLRNLTGTLLIHAEGGEGKTVFMETLAASLESNQEYVFFDCFGGGAYRSREDARHLPQNGLLHIANTLAFKGLCDPILPGGHDLPLLLRTFRRRLEQAIEALRRVKPEAEVILFLDAIDNSQDIATERREQAFPSILIDALDVNPIAGCKIVASSRTHRIPAVEASMEKLPLAPFSVAETERFLSSRLEDVTSAEVRVAQSRSLGNARVLEHFCNGDRSELIASKANLSIELDDLIGQRIENALRDAGIKGASQNDVNAFVTGLAILPPPVPEREYASALGVSVQQIRSFASDLWPLLDRNEHGLVFRDEPTETFVRAKYASKPELLQAVAKNLNAVQETSFYAARSLPGLLHAIGDGDALFELAFDPRLPNIIKSAVGKRTVRKSRLISAVRYFSNGQDTGKLVRLLVELASVAAVEQKGSDFVFENPDLAVVAKDENALRRIFETQKGWPGARHARLAIANGLNGFDDESIRHAISAENWIDHYRRTDKEDQYHAPRPDKIDIASIPFVLIRDGRPEVAATSIQGWHAWYSYSLAETILRLARLAVQLGTIKPSYITRFCKASNDIGVISGSLAYQNLPRPLRKELLGKLAKRCKRETNLHYPHHLHRRDIPDFRKGFLKASALAYFAGMNSEAKSILLRAKAGRPGIWSMRDHLGVRDAFPFIVRTILNSLINGKPLHERDLLPSELAPKLSRVPKTINGPQFKNVALEALKRSRSLASTSDDRTSRKAAYRSRQEEESFIQNVLDPTLTLTRNVSDIFKSRGRKADQAFAEFTKNWAEFVRSSKWYGGNRHEYYLCDLGFELGSFILWTHPSLSEASVKTFLDSSLELLPFVYRLLDLLHICAARSDSHELAGKLAAQIRELIEKEDDVATRGEQFSELARAILPASLNDAAVYFANGLDQMDAIGSGDYAFVNQLLLFVSEMQGDELDPHDFHTLTNICELNIPEESEKFFWGAFARAMSKASGARGLAKICRWDDRQQADLGDALMPYLKALLEHRKIDPDLALALNYLAEPPEYYELGTKEFSKALLADSPPNPTQLATDLIERFERENPNLAYSHLWSEIGDFAEQYLGPKAAATKRVREIQQWQRRPDNSVRSSEHVDLEQSVKAAKKKEEKVDELTRLASATDPSDGNALALALGQIGTMRDVWDIRGKFLDDVRKKVPFGGRADYLRAISVSEGWNHIWKLEELKTCVSAWSSSSASVSVSMKELARPIIRQHAFDIIYHDTLSGSFIRELSTLAEVSTFDLAMELVDVFAQPDAYVSGAVWMDLATHLCSYAPAGTGQVALRRLLESEAAKLANSVIDGECEAESYPSGDQDEIAAGLVWRMLGAPDAEKRWRAAHCVLHLARYECWTAIDKLVATLSSEKAGPFQAKELKFYYLHARLWLLISLSRLVKDHPKEIARYCDTLLAVLGDTHLPHVLTRHFASRIVLACDEAGHLELSSTERELITNVNRSPFPVKPHRDDYRWDSYRGRPDTAPKPAFEFHPEYDFTKMEIDGLGRVFDMDCWRVCDLLSETVEQLDSAHTHMYASGGRDRSFRQDVRGISRRHHGYGKYLGWSGLCIVAGKLLATYPVCNDTWESLDRWHEWLNYELLARNDGYWLSDGMDQTPLDTLVPLLETAETDKKVSSDPTKLLSLLGLTEGLLNKLVVYGHWHSTDNVSIRISSALVEPSKASKRASELVKENPMTVGLPIAPHDDLSEHFFGDFGKNYHIWLVSPENDDRLDSEDPFAVNAANTRARPSRELIEADALVSRDPFGRVWDSRDLTAVFEAEVWGAENRYHDGGPYPGERLWCSRDYLFQLLKRLGRSLVIVIRLRRYEKEYDSSGVYHHTVGVMTITEDQDVTFQLGAINQMYQPKY